MALFRAEKEGKMPGNYGFKPIRRAGRSRDLGKDFQAARRKRLQKLELKARRARDMEKRLGLK